MRLFRKIEAPLSPAWHQVALISAAKFLRTFGFGCVSVVLAIFLLKRGFSEWEVGAILTATLVEDAIVSSLVSIFASRLGFRLVLLSSSALIVIGGIVMALVSAKPILLLAAVFGIVSPAGYEGGPFQAIEQTLVSRHMPSSKLTRAYSFYNLAGFAGAAVGALTASGCVAQFGSVQLQTAFPTIFAVCAISGLLLAIIYLLVNTSSTSQKSHCEPAPAQQNSQLPKDKKLWQLAGLQGIDAFGGGFVVQSMISLWFYQRYHVGPEFIGMIFFWCNIIAAASFMLAPWFVGRFGLLNTMVFTHLPCSLSLCLMPLLPNAGLAGTLLLLRSMFSSMDIPVRQAYTMLIVDERDRVSAAAITTAARSLTQAIGPFLSSLAMSNVATGLPFIFAGTCKSIYDVSLFACFRDVKIKEHHPSITIELDAQALATKKQELESAFQKESDKTLLSVKRR